LLLRVSQSAADSTRCLESAISRRTFFVSYIKTPITTADNQLCDDLFGDMGDMAVGGDSKDTAVDKDLATRFAGDDDLMSAEVVDEPAVAGGGKKAKATAPPVVMSLTEDSISGT
jgi:hypothetical protein